MTKATELRALNDEELQTRLAEHKQELFNMRFQAATGTIQNSARITDVRRDVARINGILRDREIELSETQEGEGA